MATGIVTDVIVCPAIYQGSYMYVDANSIYLQRYMTAKSKGTVKPRWSEYPTAGWKYLRNLILQPVSKFSNHSIEY
mgnify:CR=1 FL=1